MSMKKLVFSNHIRLIYYPMGNPSVSTADSSPYRENPSGKIGDFATSRVVDGSVSLVFAQKAESSVTAHLLLSPPNPPYRLGFGGDPIGGRREERRKKIE